MTNEEFDTLLIEILTLEGSDVVSDTILMEDLPNLDSLRFMQMINAFEALAGVSLSPEDLMDVETVGDLRGLVIGALGGAG